MSFYGSRQYPSTPPTPVPSGRRPYHSSHLPSIPPINARPFINSPNYDKSSFYNDKNPYSLNYSPSKYVSPSSYPYQNGGMLKQSDTLIKYKMREMQKNDTTLSRTNRPIKSTFNAVYEPRNVNSRLRKTTDKLASLNVSRILKKSSSHQDVAHPENAYPVSTSSPFRSTGNTQARANAEIHSSYRSSYNIQLSKPPPSRQRASNSFSVNHHDNSHYEVNKHLYKDDEDDDSEDGGLFSTANNNHKSPFKQHHTPRRSLEASTSSNYSINNNFVKLYANKGLTGLQNIGNTCFMNCVLQCLSNTRPLLELTLDPPPDLLRDNHSRMRGSLINAYKELMQGMWKGASVHSPNSFKYEVSRFARLFAGHNQQDAQEFLMYLLQGLHEELNRSRNSSSKSKSVENTLRVLEDPKLSSTEKAVKCWDYHLEIDNSYITDIFEGQLKSALTCSLCGYISDTFDPFLGLSVPIVKTSGRGETSLIDCLDLFTQEEVLGENEKTTCDKCTRKQNSTKRLSIQRFPAILIIHLKRFSDVAMHRSKLTTLITFPSKKLDLARYSDENNARAVYRLYGVCNHSGGMSGGHYTAYARHPFNLQWHHFNDSRVSQTDDNNIVSTAAYILFFQLDSH